MDLDEPLLRDETRMNRRMRLQGHPKERVITGDGTAVMQEAGREMWPHGRR